MDVITAIEHNLAMNNLNCAIGYLEEVIDEKYEMPCRTYTSNLNTATKFVHLRVWTDRESAEKVKTKIKRYLGRRFPKAPSFRNRTKHRESLPTI